MNHFYPASYASRLLVWLFACLMTGLVPAAPSGPGSAPNSFPKTYKDALQHGRRLLVGKVLNDADSLPLAGIRILVSSDSDSQVLTSGSDGRFQTYISGLPLLLRVDEPGYLPLVREQALVLGSWRVPDLRLTARSASAPLPRELDGLTLQYQSGSGPSAAVTAFSPQGLPLLLPVGYSPVFGFEVRAESPAGGLLLQAPRLTAPASGEWELLQLEAKSWRLLARSPAVSGQSLAFPAGNGVFLLAARDPQLPPAPLNSSLVREQESLVPSGSLRYALTEPAVVSIVESPQTRFSLVVEDYDLPSGSRALVLLRERHDYGTSSNLLPEDELDLFCYAYAASSPSRLSAQLMVHCRLTPDPLTTLSAHLAFQARPLSHFNYQIPEGGDASLGPLRLDFDAAMLEPLAVRLQNFTPDDLPLPSGSQLRFGFELEVGGSLSGPVGLALDGEDAAALLLLRRIGPSLWAYAGQLQREGSTWRNDLARTALNAGGRFALVALAHPIVEFEGVIRSSQGPSSGAQVRLPNLAWVGLSGPDGRYLFCSEPGSFQANAWDPQSFQSASRSLRLSADTDPLVGQDFLLASGFRLLEFSPNETTPFVALIPEISLTFSLPLGTQPGDYRQALSLSTGSGASAESVPLLVYRDENRLRAYPERSLHPNREYQLSISSELKDLRGNRLQPFSFRFLTRQTEPAADLQLDRFYLSLEDGKLYLRAPRDAYPDRTYLNILNEASAFSESLHLAVAQELRYPVQGLPGDAFELSATKPDGETRRQRVDLVRLGPDSYRIGANGFSLDLGQGVGFHVDRIPKGSGAELVIRAIPNQQLIEIARQAPAMASVADSKFPFFSFEILPVGQGPMPALMGRLALPVPEPADPTQPVQYNLVAFRELMMPASPEEVRLQKTVVTQSQGRLLLKPEDRAKLKRSQKYFLGMMMSFSLDYSMVRSNISAGVYADQSGGDTPCFVTVRTARKPSEQILKPATAKPANWSLKEPWIHVPFTPVWTRVADRTNAGHMPLGVSDENGELKGLYYGPPRTVVGTDPITGLVKLANPSRRADVAGLMLQILGSTQSQYLYFINDEREEQAPPKAQWEWQVFDQGAGGQLSLNSELSEAANQDYELEAGPNRILGIRIDLKEADIQEIRVSGSASSATIHEQSAKSQTLLLPATLLQYGQPLRFFFSVATATNVAKLEARLLVRETILPADVTGEPFVVYAPNGNSYKLTKQLEIGMSEPVRGWVSGVTLQSSEGENLPIQMIGEGGIELKDSDYAQFVRVEPARALKFSETYSLRLQGLFDAAETLPGLFVSNELNVGTPENPVRHYLTSFTTHEAPGHPSPLQTLELNRRSAMAWCQNLLVVADFSIASRQQKFSIYDMANSKEPRLLHELEVSLKPHINGCLTIIPPWQFDTDAQTLLPEDKRLYLEELPEGTVLAFVGLSSGLSGPTGTVQGNVLTLLELKEGKLEVVGSTPVMESGLPREALALGSYLVISFRDLLSNVQSAVTVYDIRDLYERYATLMQLYRDGGITWMQYQSALADVWPILRYPHPTDPEGIDGFFRLSRDRIYRPTLLIAGLEFPGIYDFIPGSRPLFTGPPIDQLTATDARYLGQTRWEESGIPVNQRFTSAVPQLEYWDSVNQRFESGDFALFSGQKDDKGYLSIYQLPGEPLPEGSEWKPLLLLEFNQGIRAMAADAATGLVAVQNQADQLSVFDLRALLEDWARTGVNLKVIEDFKDRLFLFSEPLSSRFRLRMEFHNGILYGTDSKDPFVVPISPLDYGLGQPDLSTDANLDEAIDKQDENQVRIVPYSGSMEAAQLEDPAFCNPQGKRGEDWQPPPIEVMLKVKNAKVMDVNSLLVLSAPVGRELIRIEDDGGRPIRLPSRFKPQNFPEKIRVYGLSPGDVVLELASIMPFGELIGSDSLALRVDVFLKGPGMVSGDGYIKDYQVSLEDALQPGGPCGEQLNRKLGFQLNYPAIVTFTLGAEIFLQEAYLKPGRYEYPIKLTAGSKEWNFEAIYARSLGTATYRGQIQVNQEWEERLGVGATEIKGVNLLSGMLTLGASDLSIPGPGLGLAFSRTLTSNADRQYNPLGVGWSHNYQTRLLNAECGGLVVIGGEGSGKHYDSHTGKSLMQGVYSRLERNKHKGWTLVTKSKTRWVYGEPLPPGSASATDPLIFKSNLLYMEDPFGNKLSMVYDPDHKQLSRIEDSVGRAILLHYVFDKRKVYLSDNRNMSHRF